MECIKVDGTPKLLDCNLPKYSSEAHGSKNLFLNMVIVVCLCLPHFHFCVLQPNRNISVINIQSSFKNRTRSLHLSYRFLPFCVLHPVCNLHTVFSYIVLEFFPTFSIIFCQFFRICYFNSRWWRNCFQFSFLCFTKELFGCNLNRSCCL